MNNLNLSNDEFVLKLELFHYSLACMKAAVLRKEIESHISFIQYILPESKHSRTIVTTNQAQASNTYNIIFTNPKYPRIKEVRAQYRRFADFPVGKAITQSNLLTSV